MAFLILIILVAELCLAGFWPFIHGQTREWQTFPLLYVLNAAYKATAYAEKDPLQDKLMWQLHL